MNRRSIRKPITLISVCACLGLLPISQAGPAGVQGHREGELLVKFRGGPSGPSAEQARAQMKHEVKRNFAHLGWQHIQLPKGMTVEEGLARYRELPQVLAVQPNGFEEIIDPAPQPKAGDQLENAPDPETTSPEQTLFNPASIGSLPNDPRFSTQWNLRLLGMTNAWAVSTGSTDVVIAVLDTGIDYTHEDLRDNMWRNPGEIGTDDQGRNKASNGIDDDGNGYIDDLHGIDVSDHDSDPMDLGDGRPGSTGFFHGTACAGIIGATGNNGVGIAGVNWAVRMMAIRVNDTNSQIPFAAHLEGVEYMLSLKERGVNIRVSNHSYGGSTLFNPAFYDAGLRLQEAGVLQVYSAMNSGLNMDQLSRTPATLDLPLLLNVAATESSDGLASYSNFGRSTVDLAAPGTDPPTTQPANRYITSLFGTSFAAPHVTGAAALLAAIKPDATAWELRAALMQGVDHKPSLTNKVVTHGRINVDRAVGVLTSGALPPVVAAVTPTSSRTRESQFVEVWFSQPMDRASVESAFEITPSVPGTFKWSDDSRSFQVVRDRPFEWTNHTARIRSSAMSATRTALDGNYNRLVDAVGTDDYMWNFSFAPRNDDLERAEVVVGEIGSATGNTYNSSWQVGEDNARVSLKTTSIFPGTVWYRWTPDQDGWITFETTGTTLDTVLDAYSGGPDLAALSWLGENDDDGSRLRSRLSFPVSAGTNFSIAVSTLHSSDYVQAMGPFALTWYPTPPPQLRSFTPTNAYPGQTVTLSGTNFTGATRVLFNSVSATFVSAQTTNADLQITATVPFGASTGPLTIETPHGNYTTSSSFTVLILPTLTIRQLPENLVELSWLSTPGFNLQRADTVKTTNWSAAGVVSARLVNGVRIVTITNAVPNRFFRLYRP
jgi:thermitase